MATLTEGRFDFVFPGDAVKYDKNEQHDGEDGFFIKYFQGMMDSQGRRDPMEGLDGEQSEGQNKKHDGMSAVDFIAPLYPGGIQFIEVKDFRGYEKKDGNWHKVTEEDAIGEDAANKSKKVKPQKIPKLLYEEVVKKVKSTIWGLCSAWTWAADSNSDQFSEEKRGLAKELAEILKGMNDKRNDAHEKGLDMAAPFNIVVFLEGNFDTQTRSKSAVMSHLAEKIKEELPWFNCTVAVIDYDWCKKPENYPGFHVEEREPPS